MPGKPWQDNRVKSIFSSDRIVLLLTTVPLVIFFLFVWLIPIVYALGMSLFKDPTIAPEFAGLSNYIDIFTSGFFWSDLTNSLVYAFSTTILTLLIGMALALVINHQINEHGILTTLMITTYLIPVLATVFMWRFILDANLGILNQFLVDNNILSESIAFFSEPKWAMSALIVTTVWKYAPFAFFIVLAQLQSIDPDIYERARIEGASSWQVFRDITLPHLRSAILLIILVRGVFMFNKFDIIWMATGGGPVESTTTFPIRIYRLAFASLDFGSATALAAILFFLLAITAIFYFRIFTPSQEVMGE